MNVAVLSDIHGNIHALKAVLSDMKSLNISEVLFLGDLVINGPSPSEVFQEMELLKPSCWIKGNTDDWFAEINDGWSPTTKQEEKLYELFIYARNRLDTDSIDFLIELPETCTFKAAGISILAVHGSPRSYSEGIGTNINENELNTIISNIDESVLVSGHTHIPFIGKVENKTVFNVGSIGMPIDGDNRASYGIIRVENKSTNCIIRRVAYPVAETLAIAQNQNFPDFKSYEKKLKEAKI
ncbi:MAG: metallophosphoesterase family protein [Candidatus Hermodarchaeota archaeon]